MLAPRVCTKCAGCSYLSVLAPTSSRATRSRPAPDHTGIMAPYQEPWSQVEDRPIFQLKLRVCKRGAEPDGHGSQSPSLIYLISCLQRSNIAFSCVCMKYSRGCGQMG